MATMNLFSDINKIKQAMRTVKASQPTQTDSWVLYRYEVDIPVVYSYLDAKEYEVRFLQKPSVTPWFRGFSGYRFVGTYDYIPYGSATVRTESFDEWVFSQDVSNTLGDITGYWRVNSRVPKYVTEDNFHLNSEWSKFIVFSAHEGQLIINELSGTTVES